MKYNLPLLIMVLLFLSNFNNLYSQDYDFFEPKATVGGYGELHYNYKQQGNDEPSKTLDFHRFIIFFGYAWTEKWSFKSEVELEHNLVENGQGEIELEQAYVNYHYADYLGFQAGVVLVSAGLINEYHEPPRFLGVERPDYATVIIPTTWFGNGLALYGMTAGFDYKLVIMEQLNSDNFRLGTGIRKGRQKGFKAKANSLLYNGRIDYTAIPGLRLGVSYTYNQASGDSTQNTIGFAEFHLKYENHGFYTVFEIGNLTYSSGDAEASRGYYFDLGYNLGRFFNIEPKIIPFVRYTDINTVAGYRGSQPDVGDTFRYSKWMVGLSFLPVEQVVFKFDYGIQTRKFDSAKTDLFNLGVGYWF